MVRLVCLVNLVTFAVTNAIAEETAANDRTQRQSNDPNIFGVASVARVTSRNGRISSTGGIHFYPGVPRAAVGDYYNPVTFSKANGKYATGSVQILPGALGVSSSAQAGYADPNIWQDWSRQWPQWPAQNQIWPYDPWVNRVNVEVPRTRVRQQWVYPSFNPFHNFWR